MFKNVRVRLLLYLIMHLYQVKRKIWFLDSVRVTFIDLDMYRLII
uniref:Uncharacterized protein n=1 Tax=Anguilla anguilla TaxID=7936 RepID=A0A0E9Y1E7_ANGAN